MTPEIEVWRRVPLEARMLEWTGENLEQILEFTGGLFQVPEVEIPRYGQPYRHWGPLDGVFSGGYILELDPTVTGRVFDKLHNSWINVKTGQRIVEGTKGEFYPIDPEVLTGPGATYTKSVPWQSVPDCAMDQGLVEAIRRALNEAAHDWDDSRCLNDEEECFERYPIHLASYQMGTYRILAETGAVARVALAAYMAEEQSRYEQHEAIMAGRDYEDPF